MNRHDIETFIHQNFAPIAEDYPWKNSPTDAVFRHNNTKKWFALIMNVSSSILSPKPHSSAFSSSQSLTGHSLPISHNTVSSNAKIDIVNLKCDPDLIADLLQQPGFYPAYHMNKAHWITIYPTEVDPSTLKNLITLSYNLTDTPPKSQSD